MTVDFTDKTIIIAEDEQMNFVLINKLLEQTGAKIIRAVDGNEVIDLIKNNNSVDLILMDISMPKLDGFEATRIIRELGIKVPIIAQTALTADYEKNKIIEVGCNDFIEKPILKDNLFKIIAKYV